MANPQRIAAIRELSRTLPIEIAAQPWQPKYNPARVGPDLDQFGNPKDRNTIKTMSLDNYDHAQKAGVVVDQTVWASLPRIADKMCRLATEQEILDANRSQIDFFERSDASQRANGWGPYGRNPDAVPPQPPKTLYEGLSK